VAVPSCQIVAWVSRLLACNGQVAAAYCRPWQQLGADFGESFLMCVRPI
jgi:hypothetical protein